MSDATINVTVTKGGTISADLNSSTKVTSTVVTGGTIASTVSAGGKGEPGINGTNGTNGVDGASATVAVGTTTTGNAGTSAAVANSGTSSAAVLDFTIPRGNTGAAGTNGTAATIAVGTTTTLSPGSSATVTNVGTSGAATFNFGIPQGASGTGAGDMLKSTYDPTSKSADAFAMDNMAQGTTNKYVTAAGLTVLGNTSNTNTGDETLATIKSKLGVTTLSGSNTGDQTSVSGNAGTVTGLTIASGKTLTANNSITLAGTDATTMTFPTTTDTVAGLAAVQTITGAWSYNDGKLILNGATSGTTTIKATAAAGTTTATFPATTGTVALTSSNITGSAATLTTARTVQTNLASTSTASFNGSANITPGVTGTLPVGNGGTGSTSSTGSGSTVLSASPTFTGTPAAPTQTANDNSTKIATTAYADKANIYSTSETDTGKKWIDGRTIYRKVVDTTFSIVVGQASVAHGISGLSSTFVFLSVTGGINIGNTNDNTQQSLYYHETGGNWCKLTGQNTTSLNVVANYAWGASRIIVVIEYCK